MKTRFLIAILFIILAITYCSRAATIQWYSQQPHATSLPGTAIFSIESPNQIGYKYMTWDEFKAYIGTNGNTTYYITTNFVDFSVITNLYVTNAYFQDFHGKTTFIENSYTTNLYASTIYAYSEIVTNLYITTINTNFYLFNTNVYNADTYVSNYFVTNVFNDTFVSNFFQTNAVFYTTNQYLTYISTTNFLNYITNNYISNFWNTNIYVNNSYVSNYYTTNFFPLYEITSNYTFNVAWPLTNATLYGTTSFSPISGNVPGVIRLLSAGAETVSLNGSNGTMTATGTFFKTNAWSGPTNTIDMNVEDQGYASFTACSITGLINRSNNVVQSVMLTLTNKSSTNWLLTLPAGLVIPERTNQVAISNMSQGMISLRYHPTFGSNGVYRQF